MSQADSFAIHTVAVSPVVHEDVSDFLGNDEAHLRALQKFSECDKHVDHAVVAGHVRVFTPFKQELEEEWYTAGIDVRMKHSVCGILHKHGKQGERMKFFREC